MSTPYENFLIWMKSRQGQKAETKYQTISRSNLQNKYLSETLAETFSPAIENVSHDSKELSPFSEAKGEEYKARAEDDYKKLIFDVWKDKDQLTLLTDRKGILFEYISDKEFAIRSKKSPMPEQIKTIIKENSGYYSMDKSRWQASIDSYIKILAGIYPLSKTLGFYLEPIPTFVFDSLKHAVPFCNSKQNPANFDYTKESIPDVKNVLPGELLGNLYQFQLKGVEFALSRHGRVFIGDEMGTGKTLQALSVAYSYKSEWPLLILAPASLKFVWYEEILKWLPMIPKEQVEVVTGKKKSAKMNAKVTIMSYSHAKDMLPQCKKTWNVIIVDEAHYLKNRDAKRTRILSPILMQARRVILLSGTPMVGRPVDVYNNIHILRPDLFKNFREFGHRYCDPKRGRYGIEWKGASNTEELHLALTNTVVIRRLKADVLGELPGKRRQKIEVEADPKQVKKIQKILSKYTQQEINNMFADNSTNDLFLGSTYSEGIKENIMAAYKLTGTSKTKSIMEFLENLIENNVKFLFYVQHIDLLDDVSDELRKRDLDFVRIDGSVPISKRSELVNKFQNTPSCKIALLSLTASSQGITLTSADTVVFGEYNWTPGIMDQAEARVHRVGQVKAVNVYYLHAAETLDNILYNAIKTKGEVVAKVIDGKEAKGEQMIERKMIGSAKKETERKMFDSFQFIKKKEADSDTPTYVKSVAKPRVSETNSPKRILWSESAKRQQNEKMNLTLEEDPDDLLNILGIFPDEKESSEEKTESQARSTVTKPGTVPKRLRHKASKCEESIELEQVRSEIHNDS